MQTKPTQDIEHVKITIPLHGRNYVAHRYGTVGPTILLVHGIGSKADTWGQVADRLSQGHSVLVPDLPGHGESALPFNDYSLGGYANFLRDLLQALQIDPVAVVGHSLGGGITMQMLYQFPSICDRLVLISSGGLGPEVSPLLRAASLPGAELAIPLLTRLLPGGIPDVFRKLGLTHGSDAEEANLIWQSLRTPESRHTFLSTLRFVVDLNGQQVSALNRVSELDRLATLILWGRHDRIIPSKHGQDSQRIIGDSMFHLFDDSGHCPHLDEPLEVAKLIEEFVASPAKHSYSKELAIEASPADRQRTPHLSAVHHRCRPCP